MSFPIEKNVPLAGRPNTSTTKYPFRQMNVGDSFVVKLGETGSSNLSALRSALMSSARNAFGHSAISLRQLPDRSGFRVWRLK